MGEVADYLLAWLTELGFRRPADDLPRLAIRARPPL